MISRRRVLVGYGAWMAALVTAYYLLPGVRFATWGLISLSGVAAILAGVSVNRPARRLPWLLLAAALLSFAAGQVSFLVLGELMRTALPFPSFADGLYLLTYPLYAAGLLGFIRWRTPDGDRRSLIDALILTAGLALLSWTYLILPYVHNPALTWLEKSVAIAYPLGDVLVLAMLARLLAPGRARARCVQLLALGAVAGLAADVSYGSVQLYGAFRNGTVVDLGWAVFYAAWGAAALHPTMTELTQPASRQQVEVSPGRLTVLLLASLIAPVVLFIRSSGDRDIGEGVIAVFSAILYLLVLSRLWDVAVSHRREVTRRDNEAYFRTLVQDASDAIVIVDDAGKIRYATPSATTIFGDVAVEGAYLRDLVADGEREDMARTLARLGTDAGSGSRYVDRQITRHDGVRVQVEV
ncbi:MAG: PAS domain S-box protein, partial [Nocardiopsaceae bacterium]|nr:PAS domain S-box protein [Nocardiopsaceae bacterium]